MQKLPLRRLLCVASPLLWALAGCGGSTTQPQNTIDSGVADAVITMRDGPVDAASVPDSPAGTPDTRVGDGPLPIDGPPGSPVDANTDGPINLIDAPFGIDSPPVPPVDAAPRVDSRPRVDAPPGTPDAPLCKPVDGACTVDDDCCSSACDLHTMRCTVAGGCLGPGEACGTNGNCCTGDCLLGKCTTTGCVSTGQSCFEDGDCCSNNCNGGTCGAVPGSTCTTLGNSCGSSSACCSKTCTGGVCINADGPFGCHADGDICFTADDCCTDRCQILPGATAGTCLSLSVGGTSGCIIDGEPCSGSTTCCSRICALIPNGGTVCQVASGCRLVGDVCREDQDCCGGAGSMLPGDGNVTCNILAGSNPPIGRCSNHMACDPEGDVCGGGVNAEQDCCDCKPHECCFLDSSGVPRCRGGQSTMCPNGLDGSPGCCIAAGDVCAFSDQCCDGNPCVPGSDGILRCSALMCIPEGGTCTSTSDCCTGFECVIPPGSLTGTCTNPSPPPPPPPDAPPPPIDARPPIDAKPPAPDAPPGTPDAPPPVDAPPPIDARPPIDAKPPAPDAPPLCALLGQSCGDTTPCCSGLVCDMPGAAGPCAVGEQDCTCFTIIP